jgi:phosphoenolpyruvate carboxykinase (ATP)
MIEDLDITPQWPLLRAELAKLGLRWLGHISYNEPAAILYQSAIVRGEGKASSTGALVVETGRHTGRSPKDKFIVCDAETAPHIWWQGNHAMSPKHFQMLKADMFEYARLKEICIQDLEACAAPNHTIHTRVITELTWHGLFIRHLLKPVLEPDTFKPALTVVCLPHFKANPERHGTNSQTVIAFDLTNRLVLIAGTQYAGEIKKAVFTFANYVLPAAGVLPMHCSANVGKAGDSAIFFGLSGTGKTTLSADATRILIGDDEHGWGDDGIFNIENGCYAKVINLSATSEPDIHAAALGFSTVLENVGMNVESHSVNFNDTALTENTRAAYGLNLIPNASASRQGPHPSTIIMLTADAFGVMPPVAVLNPEEAMQQFLCGYTAKLAGTEQGVKVPEATFSACFGAPFLPRPPQIYATMLREKLAASNARCYMLNTGWTGGGYGTGQRISLAVTRTLLAAALSGELEHSPLAHDKNFGFRVPMQVEGVNPALLNPRTTWASPEAYDQEAQKLKLLFAAALAKFQPDAKLMAAE